MEFLNFYAFLGVIFIGLFFYIKNKNLPFSKEVAEKIILKGKISKKTKFYLLLLAYIMMIIALARPVINRGYITVKAPVQNLVIALDISHQMDETDLYPNRIEFAKNKIKKLLKMLKTQNTALILFDANPYLISPPSNDYDSLIYLLEHTDIKDLKRSSKADIDKMLNSINTLVKNPKIVIFTSLNYIPKKRNIFIYHTSKTRLNGNNVFNADYSDESLKNLAKFLKSDKNRETKIKDKTELFYYPLGIAIAILLFVIFFPMRSRDVSFYENINNEKVKI